MIDCAARSRHRYHTKLTKRLNDAKYALRRAEEKGIPILIGGAKYRLQLIEEEMKQYELSLEELDDV